MAKSKMKVSRTSKDVAKALELSPSKSVEWSVRHELTKKIGQIVSKEQWTVSEVARNAGTSRARITDILKGHTEGISIDVLLRVLGSLGSTVKISFKKIS